MNAPFIEFLARHKAVRFGEFTLKSGRQSPYFIDLGTLTDGSAISELGRHYAAKIQSVFGNNFDIVFGPAYKAIPIAISTAIALKGHFGVDKRWLFDRKEMKIHGADASSVFVGSQDLDFGQRVVIVDDVMTTGGTKVEAVEKLKKSLKADIVGIVIAVDRMERGFKLSALEEFQQSTDIPVHAIENIGNIFAHLKGRPVDGTVYVNEKTFQLYEKYMGKYGMR